MGPKRKVMGDYGDTPMKRNSYKQYKQKQSDLS